ncbi:bacillithiol biosynthesis cysteine-adding enzyme BshC [Staphylococcus argenteus]|uniref:bacillithiol biosynthesis cysteine-adding enzyme BshC n=1 Tax=Staphylococcus argenteus TaxID=985002 RepID=UPI001EFE3BB8|nr:bacillithiol biosynthesis cysteine-adding enzyme BshC [Staphylococcus argenteus]MCG9803257.1 bacillithiol biosynthesis cysteine-adding enzyme BshC [Staphylococcus argenteus]MCG9809704.1 bacillithiol biosynthesis cysteine-adding enzyme BshC [Staphylococcus argenteus]MCG9823426.1 bacillithiol biosynthesis cysteine-adding enzyme BshC [Staphylococcus argenteus]
MDCKVVSLNEKDQFISKIESSNPEIVGLFQYDAAQQTSFEKRMSRKSNGREKLLANAIREYMSDLDISNEQNNSLEALASGSKVVIGGQQAGLFGGPLYTFHKIFSIITLANQLEDTYKQKVVPVFWIAGEDHDFDEVNHTYVYNENEATLHKVKYHTMDAPESTISRYNPDKAELKKALKAMFKQMKETVYTQRLINLCNSIIDQYDSWSDMFKALLHETFKTYGVLFIDAQYESLRKIEAPLFTEILKKHQSLDYAFRTTQQRTQEQGLDAMIQTDTNVHLFLHDDQMRQLISYEDEVFKLSKTNKSYTMEEILKIAENQPELFSNNVVTRPLMEEWLFNTVAFIGGPSEIKYWAELKGVFELFEIEMPIVMPRLRITYLNERIEKLLTKYELPLSEVLVDGVEGSRSKFIREQASDDFIEKVETMIEQQRILYRDLLNEVTGNQNNINLVTKNNEIHQHQYEYLLNRYLLNIERENKISMKQYREIEKHLHPMGGLQERVWNPLQILNDFGIDVFKPSTYPPLSYTFDHIVIKP